MLTTAALGLAGESGEFCDIIKKWQFQGHELTVDQIGNLEKEIGDVMWYCALACHALKTNMEWVAIANDKKLAARYPQGFNENQSLNRPNG